MVTVPLEPPGARHRRTSSLWRALLALHQRRHLSRIMDRKEAERLLRAELQAFRTKSHAELVAMVDAEPITGERPGPSGRTYQVEIQAVWDGEPGGNIRVLGSIDDGSLRAFVPLTHDFIKSPSGEFVGE